MFLKVAIARSWKPHRTTKRSGLTRLAEALTDDEEEERRDDDGTLDITETDDDVGDGLAAVFAPVAGGV